MSFAKRSSPQCTISSTKGFTLIEMMITVAIGAILLAVAAPYMHDWVVRSEIQTASADLSANLIQAKSEALRRSSRVIVCASSDGNTCNGATWSDGWLVAQDRDTDGVPDAGVPIISTHAALPAGYTLAADTAILVIGFNAAGYTNAAVNLTTCKGSYKGRVLAINIAGHISANNTTSTCP